MSWKGRGCLGRSQFSVLRLFFSPLVAIPGCRRWQERDGSLPIAGTADTGRVQLRQVKVSVGQDLGVSSVASRYFSSHSVLRAALGYPTAPPAEYHGRVQLKPVEAGGGQHRTLPAAHGPGASALFSAVFTSLIAGAVQQVKLRASG